ncbi:MAG: hypothetical protein P8M34_08695 [Saprospiraceae bacterium]|nr:hypothetical protein [Saprospiraceae bacterium]
MKYTFILGIAVILYSSAAFGKEGFLIEKFDEVITTEPDRGGEDVKVWNLKKTDFLKINLVEFNKEMSLHKHPDAVHSFLILEREAEVMV